MYGRDCGSADLCSKRICYISPWECDEAAIQKSSPRGWFYVKQVFSFGTPSWVPATRAVHFMGAANCDEIDSLDQFPTNSGPIFECGVGARYPLAVSLA